MAAGVMGAGMISFRADLRTQKAELSTALNDLAGTDRFVHCFGSGMVFPLELYR